MNNYLREQIEDTKSEMVDLRVQLQANQLERMKYQIINQNDFTNAPPQVTVLSPPPQPYYAPDRNFDEMREYRQRQRELDKQAW